MDKIWKDVEHYIMSQMPGGELVEKALDEAKGFFARIFGG
jgi:hypothetical protein